MFAILKDKKLNSYVLVCNTHLIWSPNKGIIKLT